MPAPPSRRRPGWCSSPASPPPAPISQYGRSKRAGEVALQQRANRLPITILRPGIVYGPRDPKGAAVFQAIAPDEAPYSLRIRNQNMFRYDGFSRAEPSWTDSAGTTIPINNSNYFGIPRGRLIFSGNALLPRLSYLLNIDYNSVTNNRSASAPFG